MTTPTASAQAASPQRQLNRLAIVRFGLALLVTLTLIPYGFGRALLVGSLFGAPEWPYVGLFVGALAAVWLCSFHLGKVPALWRARWWLAIGLPALWIVAGAILLGLHLATSIPRGWVLACALPSQLCLLWLAWMFFYPWSWRVRLAWLAGLSLLIAPYWIVLRLEGLTGDLRLNYVWRDWQGPRFGPAPAPAPLPAAAEPSEPGAAYSQFLGPHRSGVLTGVRLDRDWQAHPPRELWRRPVGAGWSAFAVAGDRAFTQEQRGQEECVVCYRLRSGEPLWVHADPGRFESPMGGLGPRATPTVAGDRLWCVGPGGRLNCLEARDGKRVWSVDILEGQENTYHGVAPSPLVLDDQKLVLVCPTGPKGPSLAAYDRDTGHARWRAGTDRASYSSPVLVTLDGVPQILLHNEQALTGHALEDGAVLWQFPWSNDTLTVASQPIVPAGQQDRIFISIGYGVGAALLHVARGDGGRWQAEPLWTSRFMRAKYCTPLLYEGHIYGLDDGILACIDLAQGRRRWKGGRYGHGQLLLAGDLLLVQAETGEVALIDPNPGELRELGRVPALKGKTWNNPALAGRYLLVRNAQQAVCYELALRPETQSVSQ